MTAAESGLTFVPGEARREPWRQILARRDFTRLLGTRLSSQCADGVFQASLAGAVLFNPERSADPVQVASGFAVLLLPYSFVGPFAGVLLDRWRRQRVMVTANAIRCLLVAIVAAEIAAGVEGVVFYASALLAISVNRFFLSGLSASLPHVVDCKQLVTANAMSTTLGTVATTIGGGLAVLVRTLTGSGDHGYAAIALSAAIGYAASASLARGFDREQLGPDAVERSRRETIGDVASGLVAGAKHIRGRRRAAYALGAIAAHRFCFGISTIAALLLYRNYFEDDGVFRAGLAGLTQVLIATAAGSGFAALITPAATRRFGKERWMVGLLLAAGVVAIAFGAPYSMPALLLGTFLLGIVAQGVKIAVDTTVQETVDDKFRGRVFSVYDTLFNVMFVASALVGAFALPITGKSYLMLSLVAVGYVATGLVFALATARRRIAA